MADPAPRTVAESRASVARLTVPSDANIMGSVFGGVILEEIDRSAYITATRHSRKNCVTASFDRVDFLGPVRAGELLTFDSQLTFVGRSSMEVAVTVRSENLLAGTTESVGSAFVTMVAVDADGRPTPVPALTLTSPEERTRFDAGRERMESRRRTRGTPAARGTTGAR